MSKLALTQKKEIRDTWEPYVATFKSDMQKLLGTEWTPEVDFADLWSKAQGARHFTDRPGRCMVNVFQAQVTSLKTTTKDGKDDMVVEGLNDAVPSHTMAILIDDSISGYSGCKIADGKLYIVFKGGELFASNIDQPLYKITDIL